MFDIISFCHINWEVTAYKLLMLETVLSGLLLQPKFRLQLVHYSQRFL